MSALAVLEARSFSVSRDAVGEMDSWVEDVGIRWRIEEHMLFRARVCVSELAANVVEHGGGSASPGATMHLELRNRAPVLEIELSDPGQAFDPASAPPVEPDDDTIGGRGLRLIRAYANVIAYRRGCDRNIVNLQLFRDPP